MRFQILKSFFYRIKFLLVYSPFVFADSKTLPDFANMTDFHNFKSTLRGQVIEIGRKEGILVFGKTLTMQKHKENNEKVKQAVEVGTTYWQSRFKQSFTKEEIEYLNKLYGSSLFKKLEKFNQETLSSKELQSQLKSALKDNPASNSK